jgi:hypothetical protein
MNKKTAPAYGAAETAKYQEEKVIASYREVPQVRVTILSSWRFPFVARQ